MGSSRLHREACGLAVSHGLFGAHQCGLIELSVTISPATYGFPVISVVKLTSLPGI